MQALGIDMETIKSIVGHADMNMTRYYLHVQEPVRQAAVQKLSDAFEEKSKKAIETSNSVIIYSNTINEAQSI